MVKVMPRCIPRHPAIPPEFWCLIGIFWGSKRPSQQVFWMWSRVCVCEIPIWHLSLSDDKHVFLVVENPTLYNLEIPKPNMFHNLGGDCDWEG